MECIRLARELRMTVSAHGGVILDTTRGKFYDVTPTGVAIIESLSDGCSIQTVLETLQRKWPAVDPKKVAGDLRAFLDDMRAKELIMVS